MPDGFTFTIKTPVKKLILNFMVFNVSYFIVV